MAIVISFLGVGMVAIPTGIISAGFVESYTKINRIVFREEEKPLHFVVSIMTEKHPWNNKAVKDLVFPPETVLVLVIRDEEELVPRGDTVLKTGDVMIFGAKRFNEKDNIKLTELKIKEEHNWVGLPVKKLDISRQALIVMIRRRGRIIIPDGDTVIRSGDEVVLYSKDSMSRG